MCDDLGMGKMNMVILWYVEVLNSLENNVVDIEAYSWWRLLNVGDNGRIGKKREFLG